MSRLKPRAATAVSHRVLDPIRDHLASAPFIDTSCRCESIFQSTFVYYSEIYKPHIENAEIGTKLLSEIDDGDINLWKLEIEGKRTSNKKPLSTRRKNMSLDVL